MKIQVVYGNYGTAYFKDEKLLYYVDQDEEDGLIHGLPTIVRAFGIAVETVENPGPRLIKQLSKAEHE